MEEEKDENEVIDEKREYQEVQKLAQKSIIKDHIYKYISFVLGLIFATIWFGKSLSSIQFLLAIVIGVAFLEVGITYFGKYYPSK